MIIRLTSLQYRPQALQLSSSLSPRRHSGVWVAPQLLHSALPPSSAAVALCTGRDAPALMAAVRLVPPPEVTAKIGLVGEVGKAAEAERQYCAKKCSVKDNVRPAMKLLCLWELPLLLMRLSRRPSVRLLSSDDAACPSHCCREPVLVAQEPSEATSPRVSH